MTASDPVEAPANGKPIGRIIVGIVGCLLPLAVILASPLRDDAVLFYIGFMPSFVALPLGSRLSAAAAGATGVAVFLGLLVGHNAVVSGLFMAVMGVGVALSHTRGWHAPATYVATQAGLAVVAAPQAQSATGGHHAATSLANAAVVGGVALLAGLWVAGIGHVTLSSVRMRPKTRDWDGELQIHAATLAGLLGVSTFVLVHYTGGGNAWWILLTILVSAAPTSAGSITRAVQRAGGTVVGGAVAALLVIGVHDRTALMTLGVIAAIASAVSYLRAPYGVFAGCLTLALVLLTFAEGHRLRGDVERVGYTVLAAVVVVIAALVVDYLTTRYRARPVTL
ncbi:FUSC family protein [Rudaeicoccus suwonensis]|uniref:Fusaric acid resistance family protein n=1 Tax=Rudaeicoccus suwonensis TaxID=657409 RepID=A0A561E1C7_9MICO|nr:FUSC family protein [Rudaeicoccus suwonensis]TWE09409.1 fusaric acid resistance family protein [Rudaeicoccus suwonensis]